MPGLQRAEWVIVHHWLKDYSYLPAYCFVLFFWQHKHGGGMGGREKGQRERGGKRENDDRTISLSYGYWVFGTVYSNLAGKWKKRPGWFKVDESRTITSVCPSILYLFLTACLGKLVCCTEMAMTCPPPRDLCLKLTKDIWMEHYEVIIGSDFNVNK